MSKHTPGPWSALTPDQFGRQVQADWVVAGGDAYICVGPQWDDEYRDESLANAHLIAAAPELLALARRVMADHRAQLPSESRDLYGGGCGCPQCEHARAAIAKATGAKS